MPFGRKLARDAAGGSEEEYEDTEVERERMKLISPMGTRLMRMTQMMKKYQPSKMQENLLSNPFTMR
jgi:hypothetical protein